MMRFPLIAALLTCTTALAQAPAPPKPLAFDVVSIRPSQPGGNGMVNTMNESDGYRLMSQPFWLTIMAAYFPQGGAYWSKDRLSGAPPWIDNLYDVNAKISAADLAEWQKQGTAADKTPMLREMLQTMLADRCRLAAHFAPGAPINGYVLEIAKHSPRLAESKPDAILPSGMKLHDGGVVVPYFHSGERPRLSYYGITMADLAQHLTINSGGHPVQDHTGLTGRYNLVLNWIEDPDHPGREGVVSLDDPDPLSHWDINSLGLRLTPTKIPAQTLVIDHIERPSEN